jgi:hypothetical protein
MQILRLIGDPELDQRSCGRARSGDDCGRDLVLIKVRSFRTSLDRMGGQGKRGSGVAAAPRPRPEPDPVWDIARSDRKPACAAPKV